MFPFILCDPRMARLNGLYDGEDGDVDKGLEVGRMERRTRVE